MGHVRKIDWSDGAREEDRLVRWGTGRKIDWSDGVRGGR